MARRKNTRTRKKRKHHNPPWWQWVLVALLALAAYKVLHHFLAYPKAEPPTTPTVSANSKTQSPPPPTPQAGSEPSLVEKWDFNNAARFLPEDAFEDNLLAIPVNKEKSAILGYAKKIEGKTPDPQGLTNTHPGLRFLNWNGKKYEAQELAFDDLTAALGKLNLKQLEGLPQIDSKPLSANGAKFFFAQLFLKDDNRKVSAYLMERNGKMQWAPLHHASGKRMPAAFVTGTTQSHSRSLRHLYQGGKLLLVFESGILDELKAYEGYQWTLQVYAWNGSELSYDADLSQKFTADKRENRP